MTGKSYSKRLNVIQTCCRTWKCYERENLQAMVSYFQDGAKTIKESRQGIEIEHFVIEKASRNSVSYYGERGIEAILQRLEPLFPQSEYSESHLLALCNEDYGISIEPAAQLEISIEPQRSIKRVEEIYNEFICILKPILDDFGYELETCGYRLHGKAGDCPLIPKTRYQYMDDYFQNIGIYGRCMMRGTASTQISIDYENEEDFVFLFRVANAIGPLLSLLTDNAPMFEDKLWDKNILRTYIWERVDRDRASVVKGIFDKDFGFLKYANYLYQSPAIFVMDKEGKEQYTGKTNICDIYQERRMTEEEIQHVVSMFFPDVRLKQYLEIRMGDSLPLPYVLSFYALVKGIFANKVKLKELYMELGEVSEGAIQKGKLQLIEHGFSGEIYDKTAAEWLDKLCVLAVEGLQEEERGYLNPMRGLAERRENLAMKSKREILANGAEKRDGKQNSQKWRK